MATTSARAHAHQHQQLYGLRYEPLHRMRGLDVKTALEASPRASTLAVAVLLVPLGAALLGLSGLALAATLTGAALAVPLLVLAWTVEYVWRGCARGAGGGVSGMVVQPRDDGKRRRDGDGTAAFVGHRFRDTNDVAGT